MHPTRLSELVHVRRVELVAEQWSSDPGPDGEPTLSATARARRSARTSIRAHRLVRSTIARVDSVALAATIGGSVVALAGVGATAWGIKQQRESAKELEDSRQTHERLLASGERLFEKRSAVYEKMVGLLRQWSPELVAAAPLMNIVGEQQLPEPPSLDERRALMVKLRTFGSTEVETHTTSS
jgi:hypothetical protein